jgi:alpha-galactosidase
VDYCRIGCDMSLNFLGDAHMRALHREVPSTRNTMLNTVFRRQLDGRAFRCDPDVFLLRDDNIKLTAARKRDLAAVNALFGGVYFCSDNMGRYDLEKRALYRRLLETRGAEGIRVDADTPGLVSVTYEVGGFRKLLKLKNLI